MALLLNRTFIIDMNSHGCRIEQVLDIKNVKWNRKVNLTDREEETFSYNLGYAFGMSDKLKKVNVFEITNKKYFRIETGPRGQIGRE